MTFRLVLLKLNTLMNVNKSLKMDALVLLCGVYKQANLNIRLSFCIHPMDTMLI